MQIKGVDHAQVTIPVNHESEARAFYCELLGLTEIEKPHTLKARGGLWLQVGTAQVHIGVETGIDRNATKAHVAYKVDDLGEARKFLENSNIEITECAPIPGRHRFEFRDPFGNRVEFIQ